MNRYFTLAALSCAMTILLLMTGCQSAGSPQTGATPKGADAVVEVSGLSCPQCANTVKLIMDKDNAVESSMVSLGEGKVYITFVKGKSLSAERIKALVTDSGFTPGEVTFTGIGGQ